MTIREELAGLAWVLIANASGGDWTKESPEWQQAAARWRDRYFGIVTPDAIQEWYETEGKHIAEKAEAARLKELGRNPE